MNIRLKFMKPKKLIVSLVLPQIAGLVGSFATMSSVSTWYASLIKPSFSPPNWLFGPAWITLYALMGIASYLIWTKGEKGAKAAIRLYWVHLAFNALWSFSFFGLRNPLLGLVNIAVIWIFIVILIAKFWKIDRRASVLLVPYLGWVSFASVLNFYLWMLN